MHHPLAQINHDSIDSTMNIDFDLNHLNKINKLSDLTINEDISDEELVTMYKESDVLEEQADILHYLFYKE